MNYTYDDTDRPFFERAYDILVADAGASANLDNKESFVLTFTRQQHSAFEFRFCGLLGFGGKFWRNDNRFYVSCYPEDRTSKRTKIIEQVNTKLQALQEEMKPRTG